MQKPDHHYSGDNSKLFWERVGRLPEGPWRDAMYMSGVILQDMEGRGLQMLEAAEKAAATPLSLESRVTVLEGLLKRHGVYQAYPIGTASSQQPP